MRIYTEKPGPKNPFPAELGELIKINLRGPVSIRELLKEPPVKRLLSRMALDPEFKIQVLGLVESDKL